MNNDNVNIGSLDTVNALSFAGFLVLTGMGTNLTTGWKNWFAPGEQPNSFDFLQERPQGPAGQVVIPFKVVNVFVWDGTRTVKIREMIAGKETVIDIPVREASVVEQQSLMTLMPSQWMLEHGSKRAGTADGKVDHRLTYAKYLGGIDVPFGCATWPHPLRSKHYDFTLEVEVGSVQDVEKAVLDCLKQAAVLPALAALLTPIGWAGALGLFERLMQNCLASKLKDLVRVSVNVSNHCN
jgi:hypothetical protein